MIKGADQSVSQIAREMTELSLQAREGKLKPADMQGASFTISSLGGIGGTHPTPIVNAPEVVILACRRLRSSRYGMARPSAAFDMGAPCCPTTTAWSMARWARDSPCTSAKSWPTYAISAVRSD